MIRIELIKKSYKNKIVLNGVNLLCNTGKIQALLGANGSGKSTLIYIISGLIKSDSGQFLIDNELININKYLYRSKVGYVFEIPLFTDVLTAKEFLIFNSKMYNLDSNEYLSTIDKYMMWLDIPISSQLIRDFSKGMKQKLSIITALIHHPKYLILDEPFVNLDFLSIEKLSKFFKKIANNGVTILIVSHQFDVLSSFSDNFALLKDGKILFNYSMEKLELISKKNNETVKSFIQNSMEKS